MALALDTPQCDNPESYGRKGRLPPVRFREAMTARVRSSNGEIRGKGGVCLVVAKSSRNR